MSLVPIYLDGRRYEAEEGRNLLEVGLSLGFDIPYFCWHPAMGSIGACRQCAVKQYWDDDSTQIVMSCMTTIRKDLRCDIHDEEAVIFRRTVIEMLMANHPHDCPVCDEGGECHLQDMTVMTGHTYRRYAFGKRTHRNQDLGPFLTHEMNRCIQCYRCTRFYNDYAGGRDFGVQHLRDTVYFGRQESGTLENEFSGNLVEVCPVGVFDDKTLAQTYTRKWDLQTAPAVCVHCARGCNTIIGERYGSLRRVLNRYNHEVNGYFLCDRGRFGYQFVNGESRVLDVVLRGELTEAMPRHDWTDPFKSGELASVIAQQVPSGEAGSGMGEAGIQGPREPQTPSGTAGSAQGLAGTEAAPQTGAVREAEAPRPLPGHPPPSPPELREPFSMRSVSASTRALRSRATPPGLGKEGAGERSGAASDEGPGLWRAALTDGAAGREMAPAVLRLADHSVATGGLDVGQSQVPVAARPGADLRAGAVSPVAALVVDRVAALLAGGAPVVGVGSPRASLEANYMLRRLVGPANFCLGFSERERDLVDLAASLYLHSGLSAPTTAELDTADVAIVIGEDLTDTAPMLAFSLRKWLRLRPTDVEEELHILRWNDSGIGDVKRYEPSALWIATPAATRLDPAAAGVLHAPPQDIARAVLAVAHAYDPVVPGPPGLDDGAAGAWAQTLLYALAEAKRPVVLSGTGCGDADVMLAAAALARALPGCLGLSLVVPEVNSMGLALLGGGRLSEAFAGGGAPGRAVIVLENDLYRRAGDLDVDGLLAGAALSLVIDHSATPTADRASAVLPAATYAEATGTYVSHEGRAQRSYAAMSPRGRARESWRWLAMIAGRLGDSCGSWRSVDDVLRAIAAEYPLLAPAAEAAPSAGFRVDGRRVARQSWRYSGRTAMHTPQHMTEPRPADDPDSPLAYSMEGIGEPVPPALIPRIWAPGWNSVQALNKFQEEVAGPLRGDDPGRRLFAEAAPLEAEASAGLDQAESGPLDSTKADVARRHGGARAAPAAARPDPLADLRLPDAFERVEGEWLVLPFHEIFGGDELSVLGPAVRSRVPAPYVALGEEDAQAFLVQGHGFARVEWGGYHAHLPVRVAPGLAPGVAGFPVNLPGTTGILPPFRVGLFPSGVRPGG